MHELNRPAVTGIGRSERKAGVGSFNIRSRVQFEDFEIFIQA